MNPNCWLVFQMLCSSKCVYTKPEAPHHQNKGSLSMRIYQKLHHVSTKNCICLWYENMRQNQIFTCYSFALYWDPLAIHNAMITTNTIRFDECSLKCFSSSFLFHRFVDRYGITLKLNMLRGEMFIQGSRQEHWYPSSSEADQVC